jgi:transposase
MENSCLNNIYLNIECFNLRIAREECSYRSPFEVPLPCFKIDLSTVCVMFLYFKIHELYTRYTETIHKPLVWSYESMINARSETHNGRDKM